MSSFEFYWVQELGVAHRKLQPNLDFQQYVFDPWLLGAIRSHLAPIGKKVFASASDASSKRTTWIKHIY